MMILFEVTAASDGSSACGRASHPTWSDEDLGAFVLDMHNRGYKVEWMIRVQDEKENDVRAS